MVEISRLSHCSRVGPYEFRKIKCFSFARHLSDSTLERSHESAGCSRKIRKICRADTTIRECQQAERYLTQQLLC